MKSLAVVSVSLFLVALAPACTDVTEAPEFGGLPGENCTPIAQTELACADGLDDDCDGAVDCADLDCANQPVCTGTGGDECGAAAYPGDTLAIPDGVGMSYETTVTINGFTPGQTLQTGDGLVSVCVDMEHSWLRDLQLELDCPSGQTLVLQEFLGQEGGEIQMGVPNDSDGVDPVPGTGMDYCWTETATNPTMLTYGDQNLSTFGDSQLPPGDYQPSSPVSDLVGCELNGTWILRATDDWGIDNGYVFGWSVNFNPNIIDDCSDWEVE